MWSWHGSITLIFAASILLSGCGGGGGGNGGPPRPSFTVSLDNSALTVAPGYSDSLNIVLEPENGFSGTVTVSISGVPAGVTVSPASPFRLSMSAQKVTFTAATSATAGTSAVSFQATSGPLASSASLNLQIAAIQAFSLSLAQPQLAVNAGSSGSISFAIVNSGGDLDYTLSLSAAGLPSGATGAFTESAISPTDSDSLNISVDANTASSNTPVTITATRSLDGQRASATFPLKICGATRWLLVGDSFNDRILIFDSPFSTGESASIVLGQPDFTTSAPGTSATSLYFPDKAIADVAGNVWVSDTWNHRVLEFQEPITSGMAASLVLGQPDFTTTRLGPPNQSGLMDPQGLAFDADGDLWVADGYNRVLEFTPPFSNGMAASLVLGEPDFTTEEHVASALGMNSPTELAFDAAGNLWVVDQGNNRVLEYKPPFASGQPASLVLGQPDFVSAASVTSATGFSKPFGVAVDGAGNIWVSDCNNLRVLRYSPPFSNGQAANFVLGQPNYTSHGLSYNYQVNVPTPDGIAFDTNGDLIIGDMGGNSVIAFGPPFSIMMEAYAILGQPNFTSETPSTTASGLSGVLSVSTF